MKTHALFPILALFFSLSGYSLEFAGTLQVKGKDRLLKSEQGPTYRVRGSNPEITAQLEKLGNGDFVIATGVEQSRNRAVISEIQFVGLKRLLGFWSDESNALIDVHSFRELRIYRPPEINGEIIHTDNIMYNLAPENGPGWSLLMFYNERAIVGRLSIHGDNVYVEFPPSENHPLIHKMKRIRSR